MVQWRNWYDWTISTDGRVLKDDNQGILGQEERLTGNSGVLGQ